MDQIGVTQWRPAFNLHKCNVAASRKLAERSDIEVALRPIESEATEAMEACTAQMEELAKTVPETELAAIKAAIVGANVKTIQDVRTPPTIVCASGGDISSLCWRPWRR